MAAICGPGISRRAELLALVATALAIVSTVIAPMLYLLALPAACAMAAAAAPPGRRSVIALAVWVPVSAGVLLGVAPL
jgi:steroid 5-alpha reductase family enzyme